MPFMNSNIYPLVEERRNGTLIVRGRSGICKVVRKPNFLGSFSGKRAFFRGVASLGNISGNTSFLREYMKGSVGSDLRKDWESVGYDLYKAMSRI